MLCYKNLLDFTLSIDMQVTHIFFWLALHVSVHHHPPANELLHFFPENHISNVHYTLCVFVYVCMRSSSSSIQTGIPSLLNPFTLYFSLYFPWFYFLHSLIRQMPFISANEIHKVWSHQRSVSWIWCRGHECIKLNKRTPPVANTFFLSFLLGYSPANKYIAWSYFIQIYSLKIEQ